MLLHALPLVKLVKFHVFLNGLEIIHLILANRLRSDGLEIIYGNYKALVIIFIFSTNI